MLNYNVSDLASDSVYYYTVTPQGNGVLVSNQITVRTAINTDINEQYQNNLVSWCVLQNGIQLNNLPENCNLTVYDVLGKQLQTINSNSTEMSIKLPNKGIYLLKINSKDGIKVLKIRF